jgi:apolipoprotein D and lipocalin family protein
MKLKSLFVMITMEFVSGLSFAQAAQTDLPPVQTVSHVDVDQYLGRWYEVASIPQWFQKQCVGNTTASYSKAEKGRLEVLNVCQTKDGSYDSAEGRAKISNTQSNAELKVTFVDFFGWWFGIAGKYWILDLGENYSYSVVGEPTRQNAWILSRTPAISEENLVRAATTLKAQGFDLCKVLTSRQDGGFTERKPLCQVVNL